MALEVHGFLIVVHLHVAAGHLNHTVVDGLVGVLKSLEVSILESKKGASGLFRLISGADVNKETYKSKLIMSAS